jgi:hypothetical protein
MIWHDIYFNFSAIPLLAPGKRHLHKFKITKQDVVSAFERRCLRSDVQAVRGALDQRNFVFAGVNEKSDLAPRAQAHIVHGDVMQSGRALGTPERHLKKVRDGLDSNPWSQADASGVQKYFLLQRGKLFTHRV